jgi:signal peptidase I
MLLKAIVGGAVVVLAVAILVGRPHFKRYRVPSESMAPTIGFGEIVNLNGGEAPQVGDVVIFNAPTSAEADIQSQCPSQTRGDQPCAEVAGGRSPTTFIKRIVAGPGDRIAFEDGRVVLNGEPQNEPYVQPCDDTPCNYPTPITVKDGTYYMAGDNRGASDDSRFWGPVPEDWILGRAERCTVVYLFCSPV